MKMKKLLGVFLAFCLLLPQISVTAATPDLSTLKAKYDAAVVLKKRGSLGYFEKLGFKEAAAILKGTDRSYQSGMGGKYKDILKSTQIGGSKDATSLACFQKSISVLKGMNTARKKEGLKALTVDPYLMAVAQVYSNWSANRIEHAKVWGNHAGENLAWGYTDPFAGWYTKQKAVAKAHPDWLNSNNPNWVKVGHYANIKNSTYVVQGGAYNEKSNAYTRCWSNTFARRVITRSYTVEQFEKSVNNYIRSLDADINAYKTALSQARFDLKGKNSFTGVVKNTSDGRWYFHNQGKLNLSYTGVVPSIANGKYYHVQKGLLRWGFTGFSKSITNGKWYFSRNGELDWTFTGVAKSVQDNQWYFARNGRLDWGYTGGAKSVANGKWYAVQKGKLNWKYNGKMKCTDGKTRTFRNGAAN